MYVSDVMTSPINKVYISLASNGASDVIRMMSEEESKIIKKEEPRTYNDGLPAIARLAMNYGNNRSSYLFIK